MKRKLISLFLILSLTLALSACSKKENSENETNQTEATIQDVTGTYTNVTFLKDAQFTLNENTTYDRVSPDEKGTFSLNQQGGFDLENANNSEITSFANRDNYYYRTNLICCFEEDEEYGLKPTFDENGKSNQWFCAYYDSISDNKWNVIILELREDGTFTLRDCTRDMSGTQSDGTVYEGTYILNDYVLNLDCGNKTMPFLLIDEKIYFDAYEKQ